MKNLIKRALESYAKASTNSCIFFVFHAPQAPKSLISK